MLVPELQAQEALGDRYRVGLVGAGQMGEGLVAQMERVPGMRVHVVADVVPGRAVEVFRNANVDEKDIVETDDPVAAGEAVADGRRVATTNPSAAWAEPVDITIEATGVPEVGARVAYGAILAGKHVLQMNVETDATVGYTLRKLARSAGVVYSLTSGDEPGATTELYDFASSLGFEIVCVGKGKNNPLDRTANPTTMAEQARAKQMNPKMLASFVDGTKTMVEMTSLANAVGFVPDIPGAHGPQATRDNLAQVFAPDKDGGILSRTGVVDYAIGIAPGVFVIFTTDHPKLVRDLQYLSMGQGPYWSLYRPYHLTSLETPFTVARMLLWGETISATDRPPTAETVAVAKKDLLSGETIDGLGGFAVYGYIETAEQARAGDMLPLGLAPGSVLTRDVTAGDPVTYADVELDESLMIVHLRRLQDLELAGS
jgi:predicted homoserine dehydrogenase-like protein